MREVEPDNDLGRTVRELVAASGMKMEEIAACCVPPLRPTYLSQIVHGTVKRPGDARLRVLAAGLGVEVGILHAAMLRPAQPVNEHEARLPADLMSAFSHAQRNVPSDRLRELHRHVKDEVEMVTRGYTEQRRGPTERQPPEL